MNINRNHRKLACWKLIIPLVLIFLGGGRLVQASPEAESGMPGFVDRSTVTKNLQLSIPTDDFVITVKTDNPGT